MALSEYDDTLEEVTQPAAPEQRNAYDDLLQAREQQVQTPLRISHKQAQDTSPDRAAKVQQLSGQTGLPADVVDRNFEEMQKRVKISDTPYSRITEESPVVAQWAAKPENAAVASDDLANLGALEFLLKAPSRAVAQQLNTQGYGALRSKSLFQDLTPEELDQLNAYKFNMGLGGNLGADKSWFRGAVTGGIKLATQLVSTMPVYGLAGAAGGAAIGTIVEPGGGTLAGAKLGFEAGNLYGLGKMSFQTEAASAYDQFLEVKDNVGQPLDPKIARMAALAAGSINAGLMVGAGGVLKKTIPGLDKLSGVFVRDAISKALVKPTVQAALLSASKVYATSLTEGTALMVGMKAVDILAGEIAKSAAEHGAGSQPDYGYGPRFETGEPKGLGFFGPLKTSDGKVMSELSVGVPIGGKETQIPSIVPTLSKEELSSLLSGGQPTPEIIEKARVFAESRVSQGKSPFAAAGEQVNTFPELERAPVPDQRSPQFQHATPSEVLSQLRHAASEGAQSFAFAAAFGPSLGLAHDVVRAQRAKAAPAFFNALAEGVAQSKTAQRLPEAAQDFIAQATKDGPLQTVYAPLEGNPENGQVGWNQYWQSKGIDPAEMAARVTGSRDAYEHAQRSGADLQIPTSRYATTLAATEHNAFFANELRLGPDEMNAVESAKFAKDMAESQKPAPAPSSPVRDAVLSKLEGAGVPRETGEQYASLFESAIGNLSERAGVNPEELFAQYGLKIEREGLPQQEGQPAEPGTPTSQAQLTDESGRSFGAGATSPSEADVAADREAFGRAERRAFANLTPEQLGEMFGGDRRKGERRQGEGASPTGQERRAIDTSGRDAAFVEGTIPTTAPEETAHRGAVVKAAQAMRAENPQIDAQAAAAQRRGSEAHNERKARPRTKVDKNLDAAQNPEGYYNAPRTAPAAQEGQRPGNAEGQQLESHAGGTPEGRSDGGVAQPRGLQTAGLPDVGEVFTRRTAEEDSARLTPEVRRELARVLDELQTFPYEGRTWTWLEGQKTGNAAGGAADVRAGHAGAPVYDDVLAFSPVNKHKGEAAKKARGSRGDVAGAIDAVLKSGEIKTNLQEGAVRVAMNRAADNYEFLSAPSLPHADARIASVEFTDSLSEAIDAASSGSVNMLDEQALEHVLRNESDILEPDGPVDTSFNVDEFNQSLFDDIEAPDASADTLTTGEVQPRLPEAGAVREQEQPTPAVADVPFSLTSETAPQPKGKQTTLFQGAAPEPPQLHAFETQDNDHAYVWGSRAPVEFERALHMDIVASEQPPAVQAALRKLGVSWEKLDIPSPKDAVAIFNSERIAKIADASLEDREALKEGYFLAASENAPAFARWYGQHQALMREDGRVVDPLGSDVYDQIQRDAMKGDRWQTLEQSAEAASKSLLENGIAGVTHPDGTLTFDAAREETQASAAPLTDESVHEWAAKVQARVGSDLQVFTVYLNPQGDLKLSMLAVDRGAQRQGIGTDVMRELTRFADLNGKRITLSPANRDSAWGTTSRSRLVDFYKQFGFVENKGRNKDFAISDGMYREPTLPRAGEELNQSEPTIAEGGELAQEKRGAIRIGPDRQITIRLLERADPSTFLHETGHFFLEVFTDLADKIAGIEPEKRTLQQQQLLGDHASLMEWLTDEDKPATERFSVKQHEQFAQGFEKYLGEGKAPSVALQGAYTRFRAWLIGVYRSLSNLHVNLTDEVRGIMDRLVASDRAIQDAEARRGVLAMFLSPEEAGMSPEEFNLYRRTVEDASRTAREQHDQKLFREVQREQTATWKRERDEVRAGVEYDVYSRPENRALSAMQRGTHPNGDPLVEGMETAPLKLDRKILTDTYGSDRVKRLPRGIIAKEGGLDPEVVARMFGFNSGDAMLSAVEKAPPMKAVIDQETKRLMFERNGNMLLDGSIHERAKEAVMNEDRDIVIRSELKALNNLRRTVAPFVEQARGKEQGERAYERRWLEAEAKLRIAIAEGRKQVEIDKLQQEVSDLKAEARGGAARIRAGIPPAAVLKDAADRRIASLPIGSIQPEAFWSASRRAAQMAIDRAARQDFAGAIQAKQQELINVNLYRRAEQALEAIDEGRRFALSLTRNETRRRIGLASGGYLEQIDGILDRYEFAQVSDRQLEKRASMREWAEQQIAEGMPADQLPQQVLQETQKRNYRELTVEEFGGVVEGLRQIAHLAALKNRFLKAQDAREFAEVRDGAIASIYEHNARLPKKLEFTAADEKFQQIQGWFAAHRKISNIAQALDGYEDGGHFWTAFMKPINEAADTEAVRRITEAGEYMDIIEKHYPGGEIRKFQDKAEVPGVGSLTKEARIAVALNWGNETSRDRVLSDPQRQWNREQVSAILDTLDRRDWEFVQSTWDYVNKFWAEIAAKQERVTGIAPEKVEAVPVETKFGTFKGGYYPLVYDSRFSPRVAQNELASQAKLATASAYVRTTTKRGHVEARKSYVKLPLRLDLSVVHSHVDQVIHDLTHHETLIDVTRLLRDQKLAKAIIETKGERAYHALTTSLQDIAMGSSGGPRNAMDKAATFMRTGTQIAQLGWNVWTAMQQPLGLFNGMARVGPTYVMRGMYRWMRDAATMSSTTDWINEVSPMMRERAINATQDLSDLRTAFRQPGGWFDGIVRKVTNDHVTTQAITDSMLWHIGIAQRVADVPTWLGQYEKSMEAGETQERAFRIADQAVIDSHGHGQIKDLAQVQRGGPVARLFMTFYSYGNTVYNSTVREFESVSPRSPASVGRFLGHMGLLYIAPALMTVALKEATGKHEKDFIAAVGREALGTALNTMVFVRELGALAAEGNRGYGGPAGARFFETLDELGTQIKQGKPDEALAKALNNAGGVLLHYPSTQIQRTVDGWVALEEGRTKNPLALLVGPPPKRAQK